MVFGLNSEANAMAKASVEASKLEAAPIDPALVAKETMTLKVNGAAKPTEFKDGAGNLIATSKTDTNIMKMSSATFIVCNEAAAEVATGEASMGFTSATVVIKKGDAEVAKIEGKKGLTSAAATYSVGGVEVYKADKYTTLYFFMTVKTPDGKLVAKVEQPGMDSRKMDLTVAEGVDIAAVIFLAGIIGLASGSGAAVGGAIGAGAI